jgi:hypothetical protein
MDIRKILNIINEDIDDVVNSIKSGVDSVENDALNIENIKDNDVYKMYENSDDFTKGYIECIFFTEAHSDNPELEHTTIQDISMVSMAKIKEDCKNFQKEVADAGIDFDEICLKSSEYSPEELAGHDFWLTRNHHGAGFWDGDWKEPEAVELTRIAHTYGEVYVHLDGEELVIG